MEIFLVKVGFILFSPEIFQQLLELASVNHITEPQIKQAILDLTRFTNKLFNLHLDSEEYAVRAINYKEFETLYYSLYEDCPLNEIPIFQVAGTINLKDPEVSGYVAFTLPKSFVNTSEKGYTFTEFLTIAAHERFERYLLKETIIAQIYEKAREDYNQLYTLNKEKNVAAFLLYTLNKEIIPIQETITYAVTELVRNFLQTNYPRLNSIQLPLIEAVYNEETVKISRDFFNIQLKGAQLDQAGPNVAIKRLTAGLYVLQLVTEKFPIICQDFLAIYPQIKSKFGNETCDVTLPIGNTIQIVLQKHGLANLTEIFDRQIAIS